MSGPDFHYPRAVRRRRTARSKLWLKPAMAVAFVAALATFQGFPGGAEAMPAPAASVLEGGEGAAERDALSARFALCHSGGGSNCVAAAEAIASSTAIPSGSRATNIASPISTPPKRILRAAPRKRRSATPRPNGSALG